MQMVDCPDIDLVNVCTREGNAKTKLPENGFIFCIEKVAIQI